jgi:glycosyltransferase involved in cell wall biosynthesis
MASGCLVIGSNVGGIPEVITDASMGTLVPPEDPAALARAMSTALDRSAEERASEAHAARRRVAESFDIRVQCRKIVDMLEASLRGSRMTGAPRNGLAPSRETR